MAIVGTKEQLISLLAAKATHEDFNVKFTGTDFDSRHDLTGKLFVALKGELRHGHEYLDAAFAAGAALALVEDASLLQSSPHSGRLICVGNTLSAFGTVAHFYRSRMSCPVMGITGSMGKTTTKELTNFLISKSKRGTASTKSFNNEQGVPYTILNAALEDEYLLLEMGMNHAGEMGRLSRIAEPNIVTITGVSPVHMEFFPDLAGIADAKAEILDGLQAGGTLIYNADSPELDAALKRKHNRAAKTFCFGFNEGVDCRVSDVRSSGIQSTNFNLTFGGKRAAFKLPVVGKHHGLLTAAAFLTAHAADPALTLEQAAEILASFVPPPMRLNVTTLADGRTIIDDSYNANPEAMKGSLSLLADEKRRGKVVGAILGDMKELGERSAEYHREIGRYASHSGVDFLVAVGEHAGHYLADLDPPARGVVCESPEAAAIWVLDKPFDILLVKGSRGVALDRAVKKILETLPCRKS